MKLVLKKIMIGKRLKDFAKAKYGSVSAFAEACSMSQPQMSSYTSESKNPSVDVLLRFLKAGCNINWLLSGDGNMIYSTDDNLSSSLLSNDEIKEIRELLNDRKRKKQVG